jgi:hypothetical protein
MVFLGGAVLANLMRDRDDDFWISSREWRENGLNYCMKKLGFNNK